MTLFQPLLLLRFGSSSSSSSSRLSRGLATTSISKSSSILGKSTSSIKKEADKLPVQEPLLDRAAKSTAEPPPLLLDEISINQVYKLDDVLIKNFPLPTKLAQIFADSPSSAGFLWKKEGAHILQQWDSLSSRQRTVITGPRKVGKSVLLLQLVGLLRQKFPQRNLIYLPRMSKWTAGYYSYEGEHDSMVFSQSGLTDDLIRWITLLNPRLSIGGKTSLIAELLQDGETIVVADEVNALYAPTGYRRPNGTPIHVDELEIPALVKKSMEKNDSSVITALCNTNPVLCKSTFTPTTIQSQVITLPYWNKVETRSLLQYWHNTQQIIRSVPDDRFSKKMHFVSGGCPALLKESVYFDAVYRR